MELALSEEVQMKVLIAMVASILILANLGLFYLKVIHKDVRPKLITIKKVENTGVSVQDLHEVWNNIRIQAGAEYSRIPLQVVKSKEVNAYATCDPDCRIMVTEKMLEFLQNKHEAAYLLGHEIAHHVLGHTMFFTPMDSVFKELNADRIGLFLAMQAGYDACKAPQIWYRYKQKYGERIRQGSHPTFMQRLVFMKMPSCQNRP